MAGISRRTFLGSAAVAGVGLPSFAAGHVAPLAQFPDTSIQFPDGPQRTQREQTHAVLMNLSEDSLLRPFRVREGLPAPGHDMGGWYNTWDFAPCHCFGQWVSTLARCYAATGHEASRAKVDRLIRGYAATASPAGKFYVDNRSPPTSTTSWCAGSSTRTRCAQIPLRSTSGPRHRSGRALPSSQSAAASGDPLARS